MFLMFTVRKMDLLYKDDTVSVTACHRVKILHALFLRCPVGGLIFSQRERSMLIYRKKNYFLNVYKDTANLCCWASGLVLKLVHHSPVSETVDSQE